VPSRARSRLRTGHTLLVGEQLAIEGVGDPALETPHRLEGFLALGPLASVVGPTLGVETDLGDRGDVIMWLIRRFPARESRCRFCSPEQASKGAVPVQDANRLRSANLATSPTSARTRAATTGPTPRRSSTESRGPAPSP